MKFPAFEPIDLKSNVPAFESIELCLSKIIPDENQPRKIFDESSIEKLALSIKQHGVIQPIVVKRVDNSDQYQIIVGERRWRAAKQAQLNTIPAIVQEYYKPEKMAIALIENIQRENLNPLEEAQAIQNLLEECSMTHHQVAESIGRSRATVSNLLRLLNLEYEVKLMVNAGLLEMGHARALLGLSGQHQVETAKLVVDRSWSVRETEKAIQRATMPTQKRKLFMPPDFKRKIMEWEKSFSKQVSSKVNLHFNSDGKGRVVIHFDSIEEADWLMNILNSLKR